VSIENLTQKILSEAKVAAESSIKSAQERGDEIIGEAKLKAEAIIKETAEKAKQDKDTTKSRKVSSAELQARKMLLSAKQDAVKKSFDTALAKLKKMPEDKYINFLVGEILKIPNCEGVIILNEKDKKSIGEKLVWVANEKLKEQKITLSNNTIQASGGFVLKNGNIEINSTFETMLSSVKDELTFEVANALFK
jgi:V/A-type H+-transporting ATPase subunit E